MNKTDWNIVIDASGPTDAMIHEDVVDAVLEELSGLGGAIAVKPGHFSLQFWVPAKNAAEAVTDGLRVAEAAARSRGLPEWPVEKVVATEPARFDQELAEPSLPPLVGVAEVAKQLGVSPQPASQLAKTKDFPPPVARIGAGPVWLEHTVERFVAQWSRKVGRPSSKLSDKAVRASSRAGT